MDPRTRLELLEHAAAELLESETNGSLEVGVRGRDCEPLVLTALGCSVIAAVGTRGAVLIRLSPLGRRGAPGPRALAEGCDRTLQTVHRLPPDYISTIAFDNPMNARGFLNRIC